MCYKINKLNLLVILSIFSSGQLLATEFNYDMLNAEDKKNIDVTRFANKNYILPGAYPLQVIINKRPPFSMNITFFENDKDTVACITDDILSKIHFKEKFSSEVSIIKDGCYSFEKMQGIFINNKVSDNILEIQIPQSYLENEYEGWTPPSQWDEGITSAFLDYNINNEYRNKSNSDYYLSGYGLVGFNAGAWRLRSDISGFYYGSDEVSNKSDFKFNSIYLYRNIKEIKSVLTLGEHFNTSAVFDSFKLNGISLRSDERMFPPTLRGYAPTITGFVSSNATISIIYNDMTIYETSVPSGKYEINDIPSGIRGQVKVLIREDSGKEYSYFQTIENIPFLVRKGFTKYNFFTGKPIRYEHDMDDFIVAGGDISYGLTDNTSIIGGLVIADANQYQAYNSGVAQSMGNWGTMSVDASFSNAKLKETGQSYLGHSYRLNYMKMFDEIDGAIQFSGYRFSSKEFLSLPQYLSLRHRNGVNDDSDQTQDNINDNYQSYSKRAKEQFTLQLTKAFTLENDHTLNVALSGTKNNYWNASSDARFNGSVSTNFKMLDRNISVFLNGYLYDDEQKNKGVSLEFSIPLQSHSDLSYKLSSDSGDIGNEISYFKRVEDKPDYYRVSASHRNSDSYLSGYYSNRSSFTNTNVSANIDSDGQQNLAVRFNGGLTVSPYGASLHPIRSLGETRVFVDASGINKLPVGRERLKTNIFGNTVASASSYMNEDIKIDFSRLPQNIDVNDSVKSLTLTEGAVGYAKFNALEGEKRFIKIKNQDSYPPLGSVILTENKVQAGMLDNNGMAFVSGMKVNQKMNVHWGEGNTCTFTIKDLKQNEYLCEE